MQTEKLRATVSELERKLHALPAVDDQARQALLQAVQEIRIALNEEDQSKTGRSSLIERLKETVGKLEGSHPDLTGTLSGIVDGLARMGI